MPRFNYATEKQNQDMLEAVDDINQYADDLWLDQGGCSFPMSKDFCTAETLMKELSNLIIGRAPVLSEYEMKNRRLFGVEFNFTPKTWGTLHHIIKHIFTHDMQFNRTRRRPHITCSRTKHLKTVAGIV